MLLIVINKYTYNMQKDSEPAKKQESFSLREDYKPKILGISKWQIRFVIMIFIALFVLAFILEVAPNSRENNQDKLVTPKTTTVYPERDYKDLINNHKE